MRFFTKMITLALGKDGVQTADKDVLAWCHRGLAYHKHVLEPGRWSVTHVATGASLDPTPLGFPDEAACERYLTHALTFEISWGSQLADQTSPTGPLDGSALHAFNLSVLGWDPDRVPEGDPEDNPILALFGGGS